MNTEQYVDAIEGMDIDTLRTNFEALEVLALSIEDQASDDMEEAA